MSGAAAIVSADRPEARRFRLALRTAGLIGLGLVAILASMANAIARFAADAGNEDAILAPPSLAYPFGTDILGRDVLSETLHALSVSVDDAVIAMLVSLLAGGFAGFVFARLPFRIGTVLRMAAEILSAVPVLFLAAIGVAVWGHAYTPLVAGFAAAPMAFARAFDRALALGQSAHAQYARASGIPSTTLLRRDLVYDFRDNFISSAARALAAVTITLATLSFLGFGEVAPHRDLGLVIAASRAAYLSAWWTVLFPALALTLIVLFARLAAALEEGERP